MIILGIDPGLATTGYAVIATTHNKTRLVECGAITSPAKTAMPARLAMIYQDITAIIKKFKPRRAGVEELFFYKNQKTVMVVSQARGIILLALNHNGIKVSEFTPLQVKQAVTGYGRANKQQVQKMVKLLLCLSSIPRPDDAADALAVALCTHQSRKLGL